MIEFDHVRLCVRRRRPILDDVTLTLADGAVTALVGPPDGGAPHLLRLLNRLCEPTTGTLRWDGVGLRTLKRAELRRRVGYVTTDGGVFAHLRGLDNVKLGLRLTKVPPQEAAGRLSAALSVVGLEPDRAKLLPRQLDAHERVRLGLARALVTDPDLVLVDDALARVPALDRPGLHSLISGLSTDDRMIVAYTPDIEEAFALASTVAVIVGGTVRQVGRPLDLLLQPADATVESIVGDDRGYRALRFVPAADLTPVAVRTARAIPERPSADPVLVLDAEGCPQGWAGEGELLPLGGSFVPGRSSLQQALAAALASPVALAVAVAPGTGRFAGAIPAAAVVETVERQRRRAASTVKAA